MCDNDLLDDMQEFTRRAGEISRRQFGALSLGAGVAAMLPTLSDAAETTGADVEIKTPDGTADAYFVHPTKGKHPGVLIWPDIFGLRPAFKQMATRLAESGYSVLVINPFYRTRKAPTSPPNPDFNDPATRQSLFALAGSLTPETSVTDAKAFVAFLLGDTCQKLLAHPDIRKLPVRPSVYASLPADYYNPFAAAEHGDFAYDNERGRLRLPVIAALFDVALARRQAQLAKLWRRARKATGKSAEEARRLLGIVPLGEAAADDRGLQDIFAQREDDAHAQEQAQATEKRWAAEVDQRLARVERLLGAA